MWLLLTPLLFIAGLLYLAKRLEPKEMPEQRDLQYLQHRVMELEAELKTLRGK